MHTRPINQIKKRGIFLVLLFLANFVYSQSGGQNNMATRILNTDYLSKNGESLTDIKGSPFLNDNWQKAFLYLSGGGRVYVDKLKLNGYTGEVHYIDEKGIELAPIEGSVMRVELLNQKDTAQVVRTYNAYKDQTKNNRFLFYEVHNKGTFQLVSRIEKYIYTENYDPLKGKTNQYFKTNTQYAIAFNEMLSPINELSYTNVTNANPSIQKKATLFKKYKLKSISDVVTFLNELNY